ncbi:MAG TPA: hypothetical protein VF868_01080 [Bacteroidia bacterium]|jgi:hypothetical protein
MKRFLLLLLLVPQLASAQKGTYKRSNGDLLSGTWKCVKCKDTTTQTVSFVDTVYSCTQITEEGLKTTKGAYKIKGNKVFIDLEDGKHLKYKIGLIDYNSLELRNRKRGNEEFRKTK